MQLDQIINQLQSRYRERVKPTPPASDEQVARTMETMLGYGYEPSPMIVEALRDYLTGYGVLLTGSTGIGKTFFFQALRKANRSLRRPCILRAQDVLDWNLQSLHENYDGEELLLDDLGSEYQRSNYGIREEVLGLLINHRLEKQGGRTHFTTNLDEQQLAARYGDRIVSRLVALCRCHVWQGQDRREAKLHGE